MKKLCLYIAVLLGTATVFGASTQLNLPLQKSAPEIAQLVDPQDIFWKNAVQFYGMTEFNKCSMPKSDSSIAITATNEALFIHVSAMFPAGHRIKAAEKSHDGRVYFDDCLEFALSLPGAAVNEYYQITVNTLNTIFDAKNNDRNWNCNAQVAGKVADGKWLLAIKIPFSDLGLSKAPAQLCFNFARTICGENMEQSVLVRNTPGLFFGNIQQAVMLNIGNTLPGGSFSKVPDNSGIIRATAIALPEEKFADFFLRIFDSSGKKIHESTGQSRFDSLQCDLEMPLLADGKYTMELAMTQAREYVIPAYYGGGREPNPKLKKNAAPDIYFSHKLPLLINNKPQLSAKVKLLDRGNTLTAEISARSLVCSPQAHYILDILDPNGKIIKKLGKSSIKNNIVKKAISGLNERSKFLLRIILEDGGEELLSCTVPFATPPAPVWLKKPNPDRPDDSKVLAPWTPLKLDGTRVECWNRQFIFAENSPVPVQAVSSKVELLAAPAKVVSVPAIKWQLLKVRQINPGTVRFDYLGKTAGGAAVEAFSEVYFDGVVRTDLELPANCRFEKLYLELAYNRSCALFSHQGPGMFGGLFNMRKVARSENYNYIPNYMLVNDYVGMGWFDAMPFNWPLKNSDSVVQMLPESDRATVRINYIDQAKVYPVKRRFSWGLQSFPARPVTENNDDLKMCYSIRYGDENRPAWYSTVDYLAEGNVNIRQGAMEIKFKLPPQHKAEDYLLQLTHGDACELQLMVDAAGKLFVRERAYNTVKWKIAGSEKLSPAIWHHAAINYDGKNIYLYLNGKLQGRIPRSQLMTIEPTRIAAGGKNVTVDELRISRQMRNKFALEQAPAADADTLLCDNFDVQSYCNGRRCTVPLKISDAAEAGYLMPDTRLIDGVRGKAVGPLTVPVRNLVEGYAMMGVKTVCYHASQPTDEAFAGLYIKDEKRLKSSLDAVHKYGMKAIIYVGNSISTYDRLFDAYADEWLIEPRGVPFVPPWKPDEKGYQACPRSEYIEYFFYRLGKLIDDYGFDGIFLDGRMESECSNLRHGCGIRNFDGELVPKRDIWDSRYKARYLYNVFENRNCYGEQHKSGNWNIPNCFYWDGVWEGEQTMGVRLNGRKKLDFWPLEAMRGQINGIPYGMRSRNTAYVRAPFSAIENCTYSFVHGTIWTMTYRPEEGHVAAPYFLVQEKFGTAPENFLPYWAKLPPAKQTCHDLLKVSAYSKPGKALIMVANFNEDSPRIKGTIQLDLNVLKIKDPVLINAFSGKAVNIARDGSFEVNIKSFRQDWFIIKEKGK
ncbi:MAG: hypothetical protein IKA65_09785 [Lentisphaeria bacterium]|nr:hypothetical protein [Lentisphaeria bacterium]